MVRAAEHKADLADDAQADIATGHTVPLFAAGAFRDDTSERLEGVRWDSSEPTVATIDAGGVITTIAPGSTVITATWQDLASRVTINVFEVIVD